MKCGHCGRVQRDEARYCGRCGVTLPGAREETPAAATVTRTFPGADPVTRPRLADPANPPPHPPTEVVGPEPGVPVTQPAGQAEPAIERLPRTGRPPEIVRYGPGVLATPPAGQAELTAERVWHTGRPAGPPRRPDRLRRLFGSALTVILLAASGVGLFLRFYHAPFLVTGVAITQQTYNGCGVDVTGRITTNGSAGTVSYQWVFRLDQQPPRPLSQSVVAGQHAVYVTAAVEGAGHGSASQTVTLQVLGPEARAASAAVVVSC